ncbi:MAG: quinone-dependent dihydroorotate dehydrogenase [Chloroflexi bacterium]|nr:quinone-dependent dihydroorotate dehydrogenase [Chloroflexota bacterium]MCC6891614.1 quinone-dependent dihydroorotate dehydrogenase [Anaerolineae bacterium]
MYNTLYAQVLSRIDPEAIHHFSVQMLGVAGRIPPTRALLNSLFSARALFPKIEVGGLSFAHPLGLAGGFDKDGRCLPALQALGFSFIEVGTVTPQPQPGNPQPRLFRLPEDHALINRMGFPSGGMVTLGERLKRRSAVDVPIFISLGKNKATELQQAAQDYLTLLDHLYAYGDAFVINISSPNTPDLRKLQTRDYLASLLEQVMTKMRELGPGQAPKPLFVKIAPDLSWAEINDLLDLALQFGIMGIIATNTTLERPNLSSPYQSETGGLSGQPLRQRSTEIIRHIRQHTEGKLVIIGAGGIFTGADILEKLEAGASLVQAYTGFIYKGPAFVRQAISQLENRMRQAGLSRYQEIGRL